MHTLQSMANLGIIIIETSPWDASDAPTRKVNLKLNFEKGSLMISKSFRLIFEMTFFALEQNSSVVLVFTVVG